MTTSLTIVRRVEAPPDAVFDAVIGPDKIALWWGPDDGPVLSSEVDPVVDGHFHVVFRMAEDGSEHGSGGTFETVERPTRLAMAGRGTARTAPTRTSTCACAPSRAALWTILDTTPEGRGQDWYPSLKDR